MNDIIKAIDARLKVLINSIGPEMRQLYKARAALIVGTSPATGKTPSTPAPTPDKPMRATKKPRHIKKHRSGPRVLSGRILILLRMNRGTVKELVKQLEAASFPFAVGTSHTGCVRACVVSMKNRKVLASIRVAGRGEVYSIARSSSVGTDSSSTSSLPSAVIAQARTSQFGLTERIIKTLAQEGVAGVGLTATDIIRKMEGNGFKFTAVTPVKSVTGLLTNLMHKNMLTRHKLATEISFRYKIRTTTELLDAIREED